MGSRLLNDHGRGTPDILGEPLCIMYCNEFFLLYLGKGVITIPTSSEKFYFTGI